MMLEAAEKESERRRVEKEMRKRGERRGGRGRIEGNSSAGA